MKTDRGAIRAGTDDGHDLPQSSCFAFARYLPGFELLSLTQEEQRRPGSWHWHILTERR